MTDTIIHRGPDSDGYWLDPTFSIAIGFRRLAIQDLSPEGDQPMLSQSGRYLSVMNGEIYNFKSLRTEIEKTNSIKFRGESDTEVLSAYFDHFGIKKTLGKLEGMFAIAVIDKKLKTLTLIRDIMGEKPLYYGWNNGVFFFGSELKPFTQHPKWSLELNRDAIASYMKYSYIPTPNSIYKNIFKLEQASFLILSLENMKNTKPLPNPEKFWDSYSFYNSNSNTNQFTNQKSVDDIVESLLQESVEKQIIADVPVGAFLSGGIDSSLIVSLMQSVSKNPVNTFTIGFHNKGYNEAVYAKDISKYLGTNHHELYVGTKETIDVIPNLPSIYDEPFADASQIPTYLLAKLAKEKVVVSLSGDGGDELFSGYTRYFMYDTLRKLNGFLPGPVSSLLQNIPSNIYEVASYLIRPLLPKKIGSKLNSAYIIKALNILNSPEFEKYDQLVCHSKPKNNIVLSSIPTPHKLSDLKLDFQKKWFESMSFIDMHSYLTDGILTKVDRASMATSLESRCPLLNKKLIEFSLALPSKYKVANGLGKIPLRNILSKYIPNHLINRPKAGFSVPIGNWLNADLKDWAEDLLDEQKIKSDQIFDCKSITKLWQEHKSGKNDQHSNTLWDILMFQAWNNNLPR